MRITTLLSFALVFAALPGFASSRGHCDKNPKHHYVATNGSDSNDGSGCRPWRTINHAARLVRPGDMVVVGDGTYPENVLISVGGTGENDRVTFRSQHKWGARISGVDITNANTVSVLASYVTIQDFEITGWDSTAYGIKQQNPAHHINVVGNNIHGFGKGAADCVKGGGIGAINYTIIDANRIWDISTYPRGRLRCNYQHGIYVLGGGYGAITNNAIFGIWEGIGIHFNGPNMSHWLIANNTVFNVAYPSRGSGGAMYFNCESGTCDYNVWINNIFANSYRYCWFEEGFGAGQIGTNNIYDHNLAFNCGNSHWATGTAKNNLATDPEFVRYTGDATGDYSLQPVSPARGAGTILRAPQFDIDGKPRCNGDCSIDLGAWQHRDNN